MPRNFSRSLLCVALILSGSAMAQATKDGSPALPASPEGCTAIPDNTYVSPTNGTTGMVCRTVAVPAGTVSNPRIDLGLNHTWAGDLTVKVIPPSGAPIVTLFNRPGVPASAAGTSANLAAASVIRFADAFTVDPETMGTGLTTSQIICAANGVCDFRTNRDAEALPNVTNLAALNGQTAGGNWQICVGDSAGLDTGDLCTVAIAASSGPALTYTVTPTTVAFPATNVGTNAASNVVVANTTAAGGPALSITGCTIGGANAADFGFVTAPTFPIAIAAGANATLAMRFSPTDAGPRTATATCVTSAPAPNANFVVTLNGTGIIPAAPVPSLSGLGLLALLGVMLGVGLVVLPRRQ